MPTKAALHFSLLIRICGIRYYGVKVVTVAVDLLLPEDLVFDRTYIFISHCFLVESSHSQSTDALESITTLCSTDKGNQDAEDNSGYASLSYLDNMK